MPIQINKENISDLFERNNNKIIYISSSIKNLDYFYYKLKKEKENVYFFKNNRSNEKEFLDINIRLLEILSKEGEQIILIEFSLAMSIFFKEMKFIEFEVHKDYKLRNIEEQLQEFMYEKTYILSEQGQYSRRGDIIDIYSPNMDFPVRLDFFDVELEKIKKFDVESQKSFENLEKIKVFSNIIYERESLLTELSNVNVDFFVENEELLKYVLETMVLVSDDGEKLKTRYENLIEKSKKIELLISDNRNYQSEIEHEKENNSKRGIKYSSITDIKKGDYVIHVEYGIGKYVGLEILEDKEYFLIQYADEGELYVPIEKLYRIEKYINVSGKEPDLYRLGTRGFKRKQHKHREEIEKVAKELIKIQAQRESKNGIKFIEDTVWQQEFEEKFEHLETKDQLEAIRDVKKDMQSYKIMDRLVCGDVGYGKTEVAMRAAFKAIESGYQVALLAPTTILANQHYERFKKRFKDYPISIDTYSRLSKSKSSLENLISNKTDLIIGTHKLLSDNVVFHNLGLLIIDEEQKFGVKHKEKIKEKKLDVDVLTLTATPIPRTLNLALLGIRDISVISTPPIQKLPIKTEIIDNISDEQLKKIILKELSREGQVFYVSNDVQNMPSKKKYLEKLLPSYIGIEYIHSKLSIKDIKNKIKDFDEGKFQVLIASTIIENGIDISNANTMIIEDFTKLGLSQIYQLRGRVGRGNRQAYCYLLKNKNTTSKGKMKQETLEKIENINSAGYIIAMEDMNIRGAGEILGEKQHGAIESFGYDLYIKLLNEEIKKQKGEFKNKNIDIRINVKNKGFIPDEYINEIERIKIYRRILDLKSKEELNDMKNELIDRFGPIPNQLKDFFFYVQLKIYAEQNDVEEIEEKDEHIYIYYSKNLNNVVKLNKREIWRLI